MGLQLDVFVDYYPLILRGFVVTMWISVLAFAGGLSLGVGVALLRLSRLAALRWAASGYIEVFRNLPFLIEIFFLYYVLPFWGIRLPAVTVGVVGLAIYAAAYYAESIRAGIQSVPAGQIEAARAVGMSHGQALRHIVLPQIFGVLIPPLTSQTLSMIKETAVLSTITIKEVTMAALMAQGITFRPFEVFMMVGLLYWAFTAVLAFLAGRLEVRLRQPRSRRLARRGMLAIVPARPGAEAVALPPLLLASGIEKQLGGHRVLAGIDLAVAAGEVVCIIGPSGCGKSTLLRCLDFLIVPDSGSMFLDGQQIGMVRDRQGRPRRDAEANLDRLRRRIGFVAQQGNLWPHLTALGNVTKGPETVLRLPRAEARVRGLALLARVGLADKADAYPAELSGGQQSRVAIARALAMEPILMLFDEPTASLDPELIGEVLGVLTDLRQAGMTMVIVTHELGFAAHACDRLLFMDHGQIVEQGEPRSLLRQPRSDRLKRFLADVLYDESRRDAALA